MNVCHVRRFVPGLFVAAAVSRVDGRRPPPVSKQRFGEETVEARALPPRVRGQGQNTPHRCTNL